jgi:hypothetical protein
MIAERKGHAVNFSKIEVDILEKLYRHRFIGEKHTSEDNIPKSLPKHLRGEAKKALKNLIKQGYVTPKITSYGLEVSLNPKRIEEIRQIIEEKRV